MFRSGVDLELSFTFRSIVIDLDLTVYLMKTVLLDILSTRLADHHECKQARLEIWSFTNPAIQAAW